MNLSFHFFKNIYSYFFFLHRKNVKWISLFQTQDKLNKYLFQEFENFKGKKNINFQKSKLILNTTFYKEFKMYNFV